MQNDILGQIRSLTINFITHSITVHQNFPAANDNEIVWAGFQNITFALKNVDYENLYYQCLKDEEYNFILIDGAIVQMMYKFEQKKLIAHRLAFYPNPYNERFQDNPEEFEEKYFGNQLFTEITDSNSIAVPIRIDFDLDDTKYHDPSHPYSHLTLGNYKNCRIPVISPISPFRFMDFIMRNFYFDKYNEELKDIISCDIQIPPTISDTEAGLLHLNYCK